MSLWTEEGLVGAIGLALIVLIAMRIWRGMRDVRMPVYRTYIERDEQPGRYRFMLALHVLSLILVAGIAADLLLGLNLRARL